MGTGVGFLSAVRHKNLHTCMSDGRRGGRYRVEGGCRRAGARPGLEVRTEHGPDISRNGQSHQAHGDDANTSGPRCLPVGVQRTHRVDSRESEVLHARVAQPAGRPLGQDVPAPGPQTGPAGSPIGRWPASTGLRDLPIAAGSPVAHQGRTPKAPHRNPVPDGFGRVVEISVVRSGLIGRTDRHDHPGRRSGRRRVRSRSAERCRKSLFRSIRLPAASTG
jgi:hypothetical protein